MFRVAGRLLIVGSVLVVGLLLTAGLVALAVLILSRLFPHGIGPDDDFVELFTVKPSY